jgi:hypothetical protein
VLPRDQDSVAQDPRFPCARVIQWSPTGRVAEAGYEPYIVRRPDNHPFRSIEELADKIEQHAVFAVFDHRLAPKNFAQFTGAATIAALYDRHRIAPLLVTTWEKQDAETTIRLHRKKVPVLLSAKDFDDPKIICECLTSCAREVWDRQIPLERRAWRTAVQIEDRDDEARIKVVDALIPGWNPEAKVTFPLDVIEPELREFAVPGRVFFALVNTGAERDEDLFFSDFELAPEPDPNDGLA